MRNGAPNPPLRTGGHRFASVNDTAEYLACEHKLIRKMIASGEITGYRLPGSTLIRIDLDELDSLLSRQVVAGAERSARPTPTVGRVR